MSVNISILANRTLISTFSNLTGVSCSSIPLSSTCFKLLLILPKFVFRSINFSVLPTFSGQYNNSSFDSFLDDF